MSGTPTYVVNMIFSAYFTHFVSLNICICQKVSSLATTIISFYCYKINNIKIFYKYVINMFRILFLYYTYIVLIILK